MRNINNYYHICKKEHMTFSDSSRKQKCDIPIIDISFKKERKKWVPYRKPIGKCGEPIVKTVEIPQKLDFKSIWNFEKLRAFMVGQRCGASFVRTIQEEFENIRSELKEVKGDRYGRSREERETRDNRKGVI